MFLKKDIYILDTKASVYVCNNSTSEILKSDDKEFLKSLFNSDYDDIYSNLDFLSKKPVRDHKFEKSIKEIEKLFFDPLFNDKIKIPELIYEIFSYKRFFSLQYDQMPLLPKVLYNLDLMMPKNAQKIAAFGDDDLFGIYQAMIGKNVTILDIDPLIINYYKYFANKLDLNITFITEDLFKYKSNNYYDLGYINPTPNEISSKQFFTFAKNSCKNVLTIMPDQNKVYKYLGEPKLYYPFGDMAMQILTEKNKIELVPNAYMNDIYLI